jgi:predicted transposase YdaD
MPKPFDATLKGLLEESPADWATLAGQPPAVVDVIDADVSTYTGGADKVLRVHGDPEWILHLDFQAGPDATLPQRTHVYNTLLGDRHNRLVRSVVVLLRSQADLAVLNGVYQRLFAGETPYLAFRYQAIRVWQLPVASLLESDPGTLPLAPISALSAAELPSVIARMKERLQSRRLKPRAAGLWTATRVLMGLRYTQPLVDKLLEGVTGMEESVTYQAIVAKGVEKGRREGEVAGLKEALVIVGSQHFGDPDDQVIAALEALEDADQLKRLHTRLRSAAGWHDLLGLAPSHRRPRKPKR